MSHHAIILDWYESDTAKSPSKNTIVLCRSFMKTLNNGGDKIVGHSPILTQNSKCALLQGDISVRSDYLRNVDPILYEVLSNLSSRGYIDEVDLWIKCSHIGDDVDDVGGVRPVCSYEESSQLVVLLTLEIHFNNSACPFAFDRQSIMRAMDYVIRETSVYSIVICSFNLSVETTVNRKMESRENIDLSCREVLRGNLKDAHNGLWLIMVAMLNRGLIKNYEIHVGDLVNFSERNGRTIGDKDCYYHKYEAQLRIEV